VGGAVGYGAGVGRGAWLIAGAVTVVLVALASGYGYHRDELYFLAAGRHLAWSFADQGPLTPLVARAMSELAPSSLTVLRVPAAVAAGLTVLLSGALAGELRGGRRAQLLATACAAVASIVLVTGHWLSTSTFDLLAWTALTWLVVRAVRTGDDRLWPAAGVVLGIGLLNKALPAFLAAGLLAGVILVGPRHLLRNRHVWAGCAIALVLWAPWVAWQAGHGWPQLDVSRSVAAGQSASSEPWWAIVPFQFLLVSPPLAAVWIAGLVALLRDPALRDVRFVAWAWVLLAGVFMATAGKPYYLAGLLPVLIAAGARPLESWLGRGRRRVRWGLFGAALAASAAVSLAIALPVLPVDRLDPVLAVNEDVGETIGWPELTATVARVFRELPDPQQAVILTQNYGEAGAIDRYGPALGLPRAYSGHNAYGDWGPPPDGRAPVIAVGLPARDVATHLRGCRTVARIGNHAGVDNEEQGRAVSICRAPRHPWSREWPLLRRLG
jgi:4-amino-4-deoxy-L-arabinose transferase-like glycosyltransferase